MSVESEILRIQHNIANAYAAVSEKGGEVPLQPNSENLAAAVASISAGDAAGGIPTGGIIIWSGAADNFPAGWQLCDGTNGTPDLRDKFVLGAGTNHAVGDSGGSEEVTLTKAQMPDHNHGFRNSYGNVSAPIDLTCIDATTSKSKTFGELFTNYEGKSEPHPNMPPYYALCFIMKT